MSSNRRRRARGAPRSQDRQKGGRRGGPRSGTPRNPADFWGDASSLPAARLEVHITPEAAAVPRSLGTPPLAGQEAVADYYFAAVYDRAVMLAGALAAAGGLVEPEELQKDE